MTNYWNPFMGLSHLSDDSVCVGKYKNGYFVGYRKNYTYDNYRYIVNSDIYSLGVAESFAKEFNKNLKILAEDGRKTKYEGLDEDENLWAKYSKIRRDSKGYLFI